MSLYFHQHSSIVNIFQLNTVGVTSRSRSTIALEQMTVDFHDSPAGETYDFNADYPLGPWRARCTGMCQSLLIVALILKLWNGQC